MKMIQVQTELMRYSHLIVQFGKKPLKAPSVKMMKSKGVFQKCSHSSLAFFGLTLFTLEVEGCFNPKV